jgi:hypothetical protein
VCLIDGPLFPSRASSKCPAIIFAVKRTASVPGRIKLLIVSMITMNGISIVGVRWGTRCSNIWLVFLIHPNNINLIHKGKASSPDMAGTGEVKYPGRTKTSTAALRARGRKR